MMDKLTEQLTLKVTEDTALAITRLAAIEGKTGSELLRSLIDQYLDKKEHEYMVLRRVFEGKEN